MARTDMTCMVTLALLAGALPGRAEPLDGYLVDSRGEAVRSGSGACIRTANWSASRPGAGCDAIPARVVLLPEPDGSVGTVVILTRSGEQVLNRAYAGAEVAGGTIALRNEDAASVRARYGAVLGALPPRPVSFVVNFETGSAKDLTPESAPTIERIKTALAGRPAPELVVIGHTDRVGKAEANDALSVKRAEAVRDILAAAGVKAARIDVAGRGEREPLVPTEDEVAEPRNRRVEINLR